MINASREFRQLMNTRTDFKENAEITFANGNVINLAEKDFTISNNSVVDASGTNGIPLGVAICRSIQIELMNDDERFSDYDFFGARIRLFLTYQLSDSVEKIEYGTFTVLTPETYGETVIITALDDMYKADRSYTTSLVFPATIGAMLRDACTTLGISQGTVTFTNDKFVVNSIPTDITFRQLFGYIAMLAGGNVRIDVTGRLRIISYNFEAIEDIKNNIDGGSFAPWSNPTKLDGGDFSYNTGDVADGGNFTDAINYHILNNWSTLKVDTDDVVITGITTTYTDKENEEHTVMYGKEGYLLKVENPLIAGQEQTAVGLIGAVMVGGRFRQFSGDLVSNPTCEFMDVAAIIDRKNNVYFSFLTDINFQFFGFTNLKNSAEPTLRNSAQTYSAATQTLVAARKMISNERTAREQAVAQLAKDLANSSGLYMTQDVQPDKSIIYYMHDKPTLQESMIIWKLTALAFAISTDGGKTYPYGFTVDGTTITRLLYAEGIDADYIDTGALRITDTTGNILFLADYDTKQVYVNAANVHIGSKKLTDNLVELTGKISVNENNITAEVKRAQSAEQELTGKISVNENNITAEVKRAQGQEVELAAAIAVNEDSIKLKVSKGTISSEISQESGKISIKSNRFSLESTNCTITEAGKITAKDVDLSGKITATSGKIGGFTIKDNAISASSSTSYIDISPSGIALGMHRNFEVKSDGTIKLGLDSDINTGGAINFTSSAWSKIKYNGSEILDFGNTGVDVNYGGNKIASFLTTGISLKKNVILNTGYDITLERGDITMSSAGSYIKTGSTAYCISFESSKTTICSAYAILGKNSGQIGFFGGTGSAKKTVTKASTSSTIAASAVATVVNNLIDALKAYNLIG